MKRIQVLLFVWMLMVPLAVSAADLPTGAAVVDKVSPAEAKPGDVVAITGAGLGTYNVKAVFLTNGKDDFKMEVIEQGNTVIRFRVVKGTPAGNLRVVFEDAKDGAMLEEPAQVKVLAVPFVG